MQEWIISPSSTGQGASSRAYAWTPDTTSTVYEQPFKDVGAGLAPVDAPLPENIVGGGDFGVDADFDDGGDDGYDASDFGPIADNIVVDDD
jgi:hypothetical protein